ncbi:MAG: RNA polymerase factor sigma-70 [Pseudomonadota bacterium]|nr:RNA polymerase factor sigma-70 [Pseudomonadota bacterium]
MSVQPAASPHPPSSFADQQFVAELRRQMLKFAIIQLSDVAAAEDAVQEALLSAFKNAQSFAGRAAFKTWVFAILKNKIIDYLRQKQRTTPMSSLFKDEEAEQAGLEQLLFDQQGHWQKSERPVAWSQQEQSVDDANFWQIFELCLTHLPAKQAQVFMMREFVGLDTLEICAELLLTVGHLNVLLYRARLKLRECLENKWILQEDCPC